MSQVALSVDCISGAEIDPGKWDHFVRQSPMGSVFACHAYASATAPGWQAGIVRRAGEWEAVLPFWPRKKWGLPVWRQPPFCQCWGPLFRDRRHEPKVAQLSAHKRVWDALQPLLLSPVKAVIHLAPEVDYFLPLIWMGYRITPRITYRLWLGGGTKLLRQGYADSLRRQLMKAEREGLALRSMPSEAFKAFHREARARRPLLGGAATWAPAWERLADTLPAAGLGQTLGVCDPNGEWLAVALIGAAAGKTYYLGGAAADGISHAAPFALHAAIVQADANGQEWFDFEGSMIPGIERFFRQFGASPVPYWQAVAGPGIPALRRR